MADTPYPRNVGRLPTILSQEEVAQLINAARLPSIGHFDDPLRHRRALRRGGATASRRYRQPRMVVHIRGGKGREDRDVMLSPVLLAALREHWSVCEKRLAFPRQPLAPRSAHRMQGSLARLPRCGAACRSQEKCASPHAAPLLCHSSARSRRRPAHHPDSVRPPRSERDHAVLAPFPPPSQATASPLDALVLRRKTGRPGDVNESATAGGGRSHPRRGDRFIERSRSWLRPTSRSWRPSSVAAPPPSAGIAMSVPAAGIVPPSLTTAANRHCPKCQAQARDRWLRPAPRTPAYPLRPRRLHPSAASGSPGLQNKKVIYDLLLRASAETLLEVARHPRHLGAEIGFFSVLHTWNQKLEHHPHVHCVVPAGGLSPDHRRWISHPRFFLPVPVLGRVFRGKFVAALKHAFDRRSTAPGRRTRVARPSQVLRCLAASALPQRLDRLLQTTLRRTRVRPAVSRPLYPPRRHLQPSLGCIRGRPGYLSLARLRRPQSAESDDALAR